MGKYSTTGDNPVFDNSVFEWSQLLENNWGTIRKELEAILCHHASFPSLQEIQKEQHVLNQDQNWKTYFLYGFGQRAEQNCLQCPQTTALLEQIPDMTTAFFSILLPGKHIPAHKGVFKGFIRSHLGLIIPGKKGDCYMRIEKEKICWEEGKVYIFDDTYEHEVWNNTSEVRVVLLLDVIRPYKKPLDFINRGIIRLMTRSSFVKNALDNYKDWEKKYYSITDGH
jgi:beta-hydroxylase